MHNKLIIATNNDHKTREVSSFLKDHSEIKILSLRDFGIQAEVTEDGDTLEENALIKAAYVYRLTGIPSISDDTGLFVNALNDEPGIYSARYAGENATYKNNCSKLLNQLRNLSGIERAARFESVICFYINENEFYFFKGVCSGMIANTERGDNGFGYDPLFIPNGMTKTFAELTDKEKNEISHRALALRAFREFLDNKTCQVS